MPHSNEMQLAARFRSAGEYRDVLQPYRLMPLRFTALDGERYVATNAAGDFVVIALPDLRALVEGTLSRASPVYDDLAARHFLAEGRNDASIDLLAAQLRTRHSKLAAFTGLHIFVVSLRCEHSCPYCQVSRVSSDRRAFDMSEATAVRAVELVFRSPSPYIKIEFQGGEPLLNFDLIRRVVQLAEQTNQVERRSLQFVIATNLALLDANVLEFCKQHQVHISTSLDGPRELHNSNRPRPGGDSYARTIAGIQMCREVLGEHSLSALMTTTRQSLACPEAIVDEYVSQGLDRVFLRALSPYGFARKTRQVIGYSPAEWNLFYERALTHILELNRKGVRISEGFAAIVLRKMLTSDACTYVDLQSPAGLGIGGVVYNYDGDVYASDEGRMLSEGGDRTFRLGNVHRDCYEDIFLSERLSTMLFDTMTDGVPMCSDCSFEPFCGTDPVFHHATQGDMIGHRPTSEFCGRNMFVFRTLLRILEDDPTGRSILESWV